MPTYEYECPQCGVFEQFQQMTEKPLTRCPHCRRTVRRLIGRGAGLLFRGNGFYLTDYRSESYKQAAKRESGGGSSESKNSPESKEKK